MHVCLNAAAQVVAKARKYDRMTNIRNELHWLPISNLEHNLM